jgi:hypothetical protein
MTTALAVATAGPQILPSGTLKYLEVQANLISRSPIAGQYQGDPQKLLPVLIRGAELGLPPMTAIEYLYVIENRIYPASKIVGALFHRAGHWLRVIEETSERCVVRARHRGDGPEDTLEMTFTIEQARQMGLLDVTWKKWTTTDNGKKFAETWVEGSDAPRPTWAKAGTRDVVASKKDNWHKDPASMLYYRCLRRACERVDPGVMMALGSEFLEEDTTAFVAPSSTGVQQVAGSIVPFEPPISNAPDIEDAEIVEDVFVAPQHVSELIELIKQLPEPDREEAKAYCASVGGRLTPRFLTDRPDVCEHLTAWINSPQGDAA